MTNNSICRTCGYHGPSETVTPGSFLIEVFLWLCLMLPGMLYSVWRLTNRHQACPSCHQTTMIPIASPIGRQLLKAQRSETASEDQQPDP